MPTSISNLAVIQVTQDAVNSFQGFADSLKPFKTKYDETTYYNNGVSVPVVIPGAADGTLDFNTDGSNAINFQTVMLTSAAKSQTVIPAYQYAQLGNVIDKALINGMLTRVSKAVTDVAYSQFNTTNWPIATNKVVVSAWSESAPTLPALYSVVEAAKRTGKLDPTNLIVLMPSTTYAVIKAVLDQTLRIVNPGFEVVPVYASSITQTCITDGSAVGLAFGVDAGVEMTEQFEYFATTDNSGGYGLHLIPNANGNAWTIAVRSIYGTKVLNNTGFLWASAS